MLKLGDNMTNKVISTILLAVSFPVLEATPSHPNSLLFLFMSNNKIVATVRLALALILFAVSFNYLRLTHKVVQRIVLFIGVALILFGGLCLAQTSLGSMLYNYIKLLDMMVIVEAGVVLASASLIAGATKSPKVASTKTRSARSKPTALQQTA
jgi:hypothetical protein